VKNLVNPKKNFVSIAAIRFAMFYTLNRVVRKGSACMEFGWLPCRPHRISACKLFVHMFVLAAIAVGLTACGSREHSVDYYDKQAIDPYVKTVCEPAGNSFNYSRMPGPAVLHAVDVAPDKFTEGWAVSTLDKEVFDPVAID
jgi:hypothetical protein